MGELFKLIVLRRAPARLVLVKTLGWGLKHRFAVDCFSKRRKKDGPPPKRKVISSRYIYALDVENLSPSSISPVDEMMLGQPVERKCRIDPGLLELLAVGPACGLKALPEMARSLCSEELAMLLCLVEPCSQEDKVNEQELAASAVGVYVWSRI